MIILLALALVFILSLVFAKTYDGNGDWGVAAILLCVLAGVFLFFAGVGIPLNRMGVHDELAQLSAIRATKPLSEIQDAAWRMKASDANAEIASLKYWNRTAFDIWIPDDVDAVDPLQ